VATFEELMRIMNGPHASLKSKIGAAIRLGSLGDDVAIDALLEATREGSNWTRRAAVEGLAAIGNSTAAQALASVAKNDANPSIRAQAISSLGRINGAGSLDVLRAALRDEMAFVRRTALETASKYVGESALGLGIDALTDVAPDVRLVALDLLQCLRPGYDLMALRKVLSREGEPTLTDDVVKKVSLLLHGPQP